MIIDFSTMSLQINNKKNMLVPQTGTFNYSGISSRESTGENGKICLNKRNWLVG